MPVTVSMIDENTAGSRRGAGMLACESDTTLRDILRVRIREEVDRFNQSDANVFEGLVQLSETERLVNPPDRSRRLLDWQKQYANAITAFQGNGFLVLVDGRQITELDETIHLQPGTKITFLKLVPLIGG